jgi:hypothetical protein
VRLILAHLFSFCAFGAFSEDEDIHLELGKMSLFLFSTFSSIFLRAFSYCTYLRKRAFSYSAYLHLRAFSYCAYIIYAPYPKAPIFILRIWRILVLQQR